MHPVAGPIAAGFRLHTRRFLDCLAGIDHEGYHIGQMALPRKYLGHPAMAYT